MMNKGIIANLHESIAKTQRNSFKRYFKIQHGVLKVTNFQRVNNVLNYGVTLRFKVLANKINSDLNIKWY